MSEENNQSQKPAKSPQAIKASIEAQLKSSKVKVFETELKKKIEELQSAEKVFRVKESDVQDFMEENSALFE